MSAQTIQVFRMSYADVMAKLHAEGYTGPIVVHLSQGHAICVERTVETERIVLAREKKPA